MSDKIVDNFARAMQSASEYKTVIGLLGRRDAGGGYTVEVPGRPHWVYVRVNVGETTGHLEAFNGHAPRKENAPVLLMRVNGMWVVTGVDYASPQLDATTYNVAYHRHAPGTGLEGDAGAWTPAGNGVTLTEIRAYYTTSNGLMHAFFDVTWPTTADGGAARITGLPLPAQGAAADIGTVAFRYIGLAAGLTGGVLHNQRYIELLSIAAPPAVLTNAEMSEVRVAGVAIYPVA